jgi:hypothetical protein
LRWQITQTNDDFQIAKKQMETINGPKHRQQLALMLIDHGDFDEAESILSCYLEQGDPVAELLIVDARLRAGRIDAAHELLSGLTKERFTGHLWYPYVVICAHLALARDDDELRTFAATQLSQLAGSAKKIARQVSEIIAALNDHNGSDHLGVRERIRNAFAYLASQILS